jgi:hypothetical protein
MLNIRIMTRRWQARLPFESMKRLPLRVQREATRRRTPFSVKRQPAGYFLGHSYLLFSAARRDHRGKPATHERGSCAAPPPFPPCPPTPPPGKRRAPLAPHEQKKSKHVGEKIIMEAAIAALREEQEVLRDKYRRRIAACERLTHACQGKFYPPRHLLANLLTASLSLFAFLPHTQVLGARCSQCHPRGGRQALR